MNRQQIHIDTSGFTRYKNNLDKIKKSAFPTAVRNTLNDVAFDMKQNQLHVSAKKSFKHTRSKTFFKRFSLVKRATGVNLQTMHSTVGMSAGTVKTAKTAIDNMKEHEFGGSVKGGLRYTDESRVGRSRGRFVRKPNRYNKSETITVKGGRTDKGKYIALLFKAKKQGKKVKFKRGNTNFIVRVASIRKTKKGIKYNTPIINQERDVVRIKRNRFVSKSAKKSQELAGYFYVKNARKYLARYMK